MLYIEIMAGQIHSSRSDYHVLKPSTFQTISFNGTSQASTSAFQSELIVLFCTEDCWISIGTAPTAVANGADSFRYRAGFYLTFLIDIGDKVAVIKDTTDGILDMMGAEPLA